MARTGTCPGCGAKEASLHAPQTVALVESGQIEDTCMTCQERVTSEIVGQVRRDPYKQPAQVQAEVERLRKKPTAETPKTTDAPTPDSK